MILSLIIVPTRWRHPLPLYYLDQDLLDHLLGDCALLAALLHRGHHLGEAVDLTLQERHHPRRAVQVRLDLERKQGC